MIPVIKLKATGCGSVRSKKFSHIYKNKLHTQNVIELFRKFFFTIATNHVWKCHSINRMHLLVIYWTAINHYATKSVMSVAQFIQVNLNSNHMYIVNKMPAWKLSTTKLILHKQYKLKVVIIHISWSHFRNSFLDLHTYLSLFEIAYIKQSVVENIQIVSYIQIIALMSQIRGIILYKKFISQPIKQNVRIKNVEQWTDSNFPTN